MPTSFIDPGTQGGGNQIANIGNQVLQDPSLWPGHCRPQACIPGFQAIEKPSLKSVVARDKTCFKETYEYYTFKSPSFSSLDKEKARRDETAVPCQGPNRDHKPTRTDVNGCLMMDDLVDIEDMEQESRDNAFALARELKDLGYCHLDLDKDTFFKHGSEERKVYSFPSLKPLSKSQRIRLRRKKLQAKLQAVEEHERIKITFSESSADYLAGTRKYILDSGASFHLVDPGKLTDDEKRSIEKIPEPITLETANGEVTVDERCLVTVKELGIQVWAFLHEDTVCVISLGLLVDRSGFTFNWQPGKAPTLTKGDKTITAQPAFNVPVIYASKYFEARKASKIARPAGGNSFAVPSLEQIIQEEMKGQEDLIPDPPPPKDDAARPAELGPSEKQLTLEETPKLPRQGRSCP